VTEKRSDEVLVATASIAEADAYLASFGDPTGTAARRADLITELRERLPRTALADEVIEAIANATGGV
jgi:hypothetical protein